MPTINLAARCDVPRAACLQITRDPTLDLADGDMFRMARELYALCMSTGKSLDDVMSACRNDPRLYVEAAWMYVESALGDQRFASIRREHFNDIVLAVLMMQYKKANRDVVMSVLPTFCVGILDYATFHWVSRQPSINIDPIKHMLESMKTGGVTMTMPMIRFAVLVSLETQDKALANILVRYVDEDSLDPLSDWLSTKNHPMVPDVIDCIYGRYEDRYQAW